MAAILTQEEARRAWVAFHAMQGVPNEMKINLRTSKPGTGIVVHNMTRDLTVARFENYFVKEKEVYPHILALAQRYGLAR